MAARRAKGRGDDLLKELRELDLNVLGPQGVTRALDMTKAEYERTRSFQWLIERSAGQLGALRNFQLKLIAYRHQGKILARFEAAMEERVGPYRLTRDNQMYFSLTDKNKTKVATVAFNTVFRTCGGWRRVAVGHTFDPKLFGKVEGLSVHTRGNATARRC